MHKLMNCEFNKFTKSKKNKLMLLVLIIYFISLMIIYTIANGKYFSKLERYMEEQQLHAEGHIRVINFQKQANEDQHLEYEIDPLELEFWNIEKITSIQLKHLYKTNKNEDLKRILRVEIEKYENLLDGVEKGFISKASLDAREQSVSELKKQIILNNYLLENDIVPLESPYKLTGINFLVLLLKDANPMIIIILLSLFCIDVFLNEMEEGSYKLHFTQPFTRKKIFISKITTAILFTIGIVFALILIMFIILSLINGVGSGDYPQTIAESNILFFLGNNLGNLNNIEITSSIHYIVLGHIMLLVLVISITIITLAISIFTNSSSSTLGILTSIFMMSFVLNTFGEEESLINLFYPLSYLNIDAVLNAQVKSSYLLGLIVNLLICIILIILSYKVLMKRDLLEVGS